MTTRGDISPLGNGEKWGIFFSPLNVSTFTFEKATNTSITGNLSILKHKCHPNDFLVINIRKLQLFHESYFVPKDTNMEANELGELGEL